MKSRQSVPFPGSSRRIWRWAIWLLVFIVGAIALYTLRMRLPLVDSTEMCSAWQAVIKAEQEGNIDIALRELERIRNRHIDESTFNCDEVEFRLRIKKHDFVNAANCAARWRAWMREMTRGGMTFPLRQEALAWGLEAAARRKAGDYRRAVHCVTNGVLLLQQEPGKQVAHNTRIDYSGIVLMAEVYLLTSVMKRDELLSTQLWLEQHVDPHPYVYAARALMLWQSGDTDEAERMWSAPATRHIDSVEQAFGLTVPSRKDVLSGESVRP